MMSKLCSSMCRSHAIEPQPSLPANRKTSVLRILRINAGFVGFRLSSIRIFAIFLINCLRCKLKQCKKLETLRKADKQSKPSSLLNDLHQQGNACRPARLHICSTLISNRFSRLNGLKLTRRNNPSYAWRFKLFRLWFCAMLYLRLWETQI